VAFARLPDVILTTFGDMLRVTGSESSLEQSKAEGAEVRVVYSPRDALALAREHPDKSMIFVGVGFETTSPTIAATVKEARENGVANFFVQPAFKLVPEALRAILEMGRVKLQGFLCPGHVSTIIGSRPYEFIPRDFGKPCVIAGFEPVDILEAVVMLLEQIRSGKPRVEIQYRRTVRPEGNPQAVALMEEVFEPCDSEWRAIGMIPKTGLAFRKEYKDFDATKRFPVTLPIPVDPPGCLCGEVMMGIHAPRDCSLFGTGCTPAHPVGPCMVSSEGACAAWFKYGER
jgi:hydrogenase expression/formation protein HypD